MDRRLKTPAQYFIAAILLPFLALMLGGCDYLSKSSSSDAGSKSELSDADRPSLRILLIDQPPQIADLLTRRWAAVSEQTLQFETVPEDAAESFDVRFDVVLMPTYLMPTLVENKKISPLPESLADSHSNEIGQNTSDAGSVEPPANRNLTPISPHWASSVRYGGDSYAIPLGDSLSMVLISSVGGEQAEIDWSTIKLNALFPNLESSQLPSSEPLMLEEFLTIAASIRQDPYDSSILFKLLECRARIDEPAMIEAAKLWRAARSNKTEGDGKQSLKVGLGLASSIATADLKNVSSSVSRSEATDGEKWQVPYAKGLESRVGEPLKSGSIDLGLSPAIALSSKTRQSARSIFFMHWLDESSQRDALASVCPYVLSSGAKRQLVSDDRSMLTSYQVAANAAGRVLTNVPRCFAIDGGQRYRAELNTALVQLLDGSESTEDVMTRCNQRWEKITDSIGRSAQQDSLEKSLHIQH